MDIKRAVGRRMKGVRQRKGWTQDQLAEHMGLSSKYISGIERGVENPTMETLLRLARVLDIEPYDLFLFGASEDSERLVRKAVEKMVREADQHQLRVHFDVMRSILATSGA